MDCAAVLAAQAALLLPHGRAVAHLRHNGLDFRRDFSNQFTCAPNDEIEFQIRFPESEENKRSCDSHTERLVRGPHVHRALALYILNLFSSCVATFLPD